MRKEMREKLDKSIEWFIDQIMNELKANRERAISLIEDYLERNW